MIFLLPCPGCSRHVRSSEEVCPFCAAALPPVGPRVFMEVPPRLGRLAAFTFAASVAATGVVFVDGCSSQTLYGAPVDDAGANAPVYGEPAPPRDAGGEGG